VGGKPRDRPAEQAAISAATDRLLTGTPLRSAGKLTVSGLITESGLRRDIVYEHTALVDAFKARAKVQRSTPLAMQQLAAQHASANRELAAKKEELTAEREAVAVLRKMVAELSLELQQARGQLAVAQNITLLRQTDGAGPAAGHRMRRPAP
jgi:alpha-galactosidase/6-phospho-beta-glucosidase family protein